MKDSDTRSDLQKRIAAELQDKMKKAKVPDTTDIDGVEDSGFVVNTEKTRRFGWLWIVLIAVLVALAIVAIIVV